jgi:4-hydroxy-tetrahydrodipicolinate reductase
MTLPLKIAVGGALGQMGRAVVEAVAADPAFTLVGRFGRPGVEREGLVGAETAIEAADVVLDFTTGTASAALAETCAARDGPALVIGSTGFEPIDLARIAEAARKVPIVRAGNFSLGVNMLMGFVAKAARALPPEAWDIEIFEAHHRRKIDAPSGTALMLGEAAAAGRGVLLGAVERRERNGVAGERPRGEIGFSVLRAGGIVGEHIGFIYVGARDDYGYNQAHAEGAAALKKMPGIKVVEEEKVPETDAVEKTMESMINLDGATLLFPTSFGYYTRT